MEVVAVVEVVAAVEAVAADAGRAGWAVLPPPVLVAHASVPVAGTGSHTWLGSPVIRKSARSAAHRWSGNDK